MVKSMTERPRTGALPPPPITALQKALNSDSIEVDWLAGDGSDRCYYRISNYDNNKSYVLMQLSGNDAQALKDGGYEWINISKTLEKNGIFVPKVIATIPEFAAIIIEDYGNLMLESYAIKYHNELLSSIVENHYEVAIKIICKLLKIPKSPNEGWCQRAFDEDRLKWELNFFKEKYLKNILNIQFNDDEEQAFTRDITALSKHLGEYAKYFVHRDYHSRNLMINQDFMAVLDFQDARLGPPAYDLVSLVFDSYVPLTSDQRTELLNLGFKLIEAKISKDVSIEAQMTWKATLLHRQFKALGSFGYLTTEKNRGNYLQYCTPALFTILDNHLEDERWPFLSTELPQIIKKFQGLN